MLRKSLAYVTLVLSFLASGCSSPTIPQTDLLIGSWLAFETELDGVVRDLSHPRATGIGRFDFAADSTARIHLWFDGHLSIIPLTLEWKTEGNELFTRPDSEGSWWSHGTYSVNKRILVITYMHMDGTDVTPEVWRYSRVTS